MVHPDAPGGRYWKCETRGLMPIPRVQVLGFRGSTPSELIYTCSGCRKDRSTRVAPSFGGASRRRRQESNGNNEHCEDSNIV